MTDHRKELREAHDIHRRRATFDAEQQERAIVKLAGHELWSMAQIAAIVGVPKHHVYKLVTKTDHTGGKFNPASIELILEEIANKDRNEPNRALTARILADGTSSYMLEKLTGQDVSTIKWRALQHRLSAEGIS